MPRITDTNGVAPIDLEHKPLSLAVIMITLNEAHNLEAVLDNIQGWAEEVFIVDSYSADETVDIALRRGVHVVQRAFCGFGDQWNFALERLPISSKWTMKLDPDERLSNELKVSIRTAIELAEADAFSITRRLWFMSKPLPICQNLIRVWRTGKCRFTDVLVNEHPIVEGVTVTLEGDLEHHDSPDLHHWVEKQNRYTSVEAISIYRGAPLAASPKLFGNALQLRMWFKKNFMHIPCRYLINLGMNLIQVKVWRSGRVGFTWARLRVWARRMKEDKLNEMRITGCEIIVPASRTGSPNPKAIQVESSEGYNQK